MNDIIVVVEINRKNKELLTQKNVDKTAIVGITKVLNVIDLSNIYSWAINNTDMDTARGFRPTDFKKYQRCISQIQDKIYWFYKNWIFTFITFIKHS